MLPPMSNVCFYIESFFLSREFLFPLPLNCRGEQSIIKTIMEVQQVFNHYQRLSQRPIDTYRYCPRCGAKYRPASPGSLKGYQCLRCGYVLYQNPSPGVVAVIIEHEKVLLGKRAQDVYMGGRWSLPGGFIEFDEDFLSAAHREITEETGLSVEITSIFSVISNFLKPDLHTLVIVVLARIISGDLSPGDDMVKLSWFPLSGPLPDMAFSADRHVIESYHDTRLEGIPIDQRFSMVTHS
jgi:8-oxo-dGTP diphosphatase